MSSVNIPPVALTIAGSDPSGGAGIQADLKTFSALGAFGTSVLTALTAQNTLGVTGVHHVPEDFVRAQFTTLTSDVRIDAIKIGMLATAGLATAVGELLSGYQRQRAAAGLTPAYVVLDPVMVATSGDRLLDEDATAAIRGLLPLADVVTPNLPEAAVLLGSDEAGDVAGMRAQALALRDLGARAALVKGGHRLDAAATDVFADSGGVIDLAAQAVDTPHTHGTGCTLSSALAALRPQRDGWRAAVIDAKEWITQALIHAGELGIGHGHGPVHHFWQLWGGRG